MTLSRGLASDSTKIALLFGWSAARKLAGSSGSTKVQLMPIRLKVTANCNGPGPAVEGAGRDEMIAGFQQRQHRGHLGRHAARGRE